MGPQKIQRQVNDQERVNAPVLNIPANINIGEVRNTPIEMEENHEIPFEAPDNIDKSTVTSMTAEDFGNCTVIRGLDFYGYKNLETIELPASITKIKQFAFAKLPKLKEVIIPDGEIEIDSYAFFSCENLKRVRLPEGLTEIKTGTFSDCRKLSRIRIPDSVTKIEEFAFFACGKSFKATNVPKNATIASTAFSKGRKLYSKKRAKPLKCCLKKRRNDGIQVNPPFVPKNQNLNDFYNDGFVANLDKSNPDMGSVMTGAIQEVAETISVANRIPSVEDATYYDVDFKSIEAATNTVDPGIIIESAQIMEPETISELIIGTNSVVSPNWPSANNIFNGPNVNDSNPDMESIILENVPVEEPDIVEPAITPVEGPAIVVPTATPVEESDIVEPTHVENNSVIFNEVPVEQNEIIAGANDMPKSGIEITLDGILDKVNAKSIEVANTNKVNNTRVETDEKLLERLVNLYMINALNISTPYIYNQSGLTEKFRRYDGNRTEMTMEKENGVERIKHNVDKGEGSSNMMRILYPSSAGTLAIEGGYLEVFKRDCAPTAELIGEIVAHLYKYRKDKETGLKNKVLDPKILSNMSAYLGTKDEEDPKTAAQKREEIKNNIIGNYIENKRIFNKLIAIKSSRAQNAFAKLNNIQDLPESIANIIGSGEYSEEKYDEIMKLTNKPLTLPKEISDEDKKKVIAENIKLTKAYKKINKDLDISFTAGDITEGLQGISNIIENASVIKALNIYQNETSRVENTINETKKLIDEFLSLKFIRRDSITTFIALIKNAEVMIDQESDNIDGDNDRVLPKYTTEHMLMTYVLKEFGNTSDLNKFYDKVQAEIPIEEREDVKENAYVQKRDILQKAIEVFKKYKYSRNSPYKRNAFENAKAKRFNLTKVNDENDKIINIKAKTVDDTFTDCADTATRHLINLLSYGGEENGWNFIYDEKDIEVVKKLEVISDKVLGAIQDNKEIVYDELEDRVKAFFYYQNKFGADDAHDIVAHTFWNYVISNMDAVQGEDSPYYNLNYNSDNNTIRTNELLPGYINFLKLSYNIAHALKAGKELKTANGTAYDGEDGQLIKAKNAIDALMGESYSSKSIGELKPLLQTAIAEVFSLYNKELQNVHFAELVKGGRAGNDIVDDSFKVGSNFKIGVPRSKDNNLDFDMKIVNMHAETHHTPYVSELTSDEKYEACKDIPQLGLLPSMKDYGSKRYLSLFNKLFTSAQEGVIDENVNNSNFYNKLALQNMIGLIDDEGVMDHINIKKMLKLFVDCKERIKINRISKKSDNNGRDIVTQEKPVYLEEYLKTKFIDNIKRNDANSSKYISLLEFSYGFGEETMVNPIYRSVAFDILEKAKNIYKDDECYYHFELVDGKARIDALITLTGNVKLPKEVELGENKYPVKLIALAENESIVSLEIPDSVTSIGERAFQNCEKLIRVIIPNSVQSIGKCAFQSCEELESITIPDSVTSIGARAFDSCFELRSVIIPNSITQLEPFVFNNCDSLESIELPQSLVVEQKLYNAGIILREFSQEILENNRVRLTSRDN